MISKKILKYFCDFRKPFLVDDIKQNKLQRHFIDRIKLQVSAGQGGNGSFTFYCDRFKSKGPPDGGCGGIGGDIYLKANKSLFDLHHFRKKDIEGNQGGSGGPHGRDGKKGGRLVFQVPVGTLIYCLKKQQNKQQPKKIFIGDLDIDKKQILVAKGGMNGKGNKRFPDLDKSHRLGKPGQTKQLFLQVKTLADVGLVGLPNIGKSTFLAAISRAMPKIANYQFTTLHPSVGIVKFIDGVEISVADIPGIIQQAHKDKGLGLQFLKHIERTNTLIYMIDISKPDPLRQLEILKAQLYFYKKQFKNKKSVVVFNKCDCSENSFDIFAQSQKLIQQKCFLISAKHGIGLSELIVYLRQIVAKQ